MLLLRTTSRLIMFAFLTSRIWMIYKQFNTWMFIDIRWQRTVKLIIVERFLIDYKQISTDSTYFCKNTSMQYGFSFTLNKRENFNSAPWILGFDFLFLFSLGMVNRPSAIMIQAETWIDFEACPFLFLGNFPPPCEEVQSWAIWAAMLDYILSTDACKRIILNHPAPVELPAL